MGAAGMSGFGALLPTPRVAEKPAWRPLADLRMRVALREAALAEELARQNDLLRSLNQPLAHRVASLEKAIEILSRITADTAPPPAVALLAAVSTAAISPAGVCGLSPSALASS